MSSSIVSVIIPTYNYGHYIADAIKSVLGQQNDAVAAEIIVVDDGSSDDTASRVKEFGPAIKYIYQENQGLSVARNQGIRAATGDYLVFLDADDLLGPDYLASQLKNFAKQPELDISVCRAYDVYEDSKTIELWKLYSAHLNMHLCFNNIAPVHTFMIRNHHQEQLLFDPALSACEDQNYWIKLATAGQYMGCNPHTFVVYRRHGGSLTTKNIQQFSFSIAMHYQIDKYLNCAANFSEAAKYVAFLAHATGCLNTLYGITGWDERIRKKLVNESARAVLNAAASIPKKPIEDPYLITAEQYYVSRFFVIAGGYCTEYLAHLNKAISFLSYRHPKLAKMQLDTLNQRANNIEKRLYCDARELTTTREERQKFFQELGYKYDLNGNY